MECYDSGIDLSLLEFRVSGQTGTNNSCANLSLSIVELDSAWMLTE